MCGVGIENGMSAFGAFVGISWVKERMKVLHGSCWRIRVAGGLDAIERGRDAAQYSNDQ